MAFRDLVVPCRGRVLSVDDDGFIHADPAAGLEPVDVPTLAVDAGGPNAMPFRTVVLSYDLDAQTCVVRIETDDAAWLTAVAANWPARGTEQQRDADIKATWDLGLETEQQVRDRALATVEISQTVLNKWRQL